MRIEVKKFFDETMDTSSYEGYSFIFSLTEAEQSNAVMVLANKLYNMIINKIEDIDYREIERSDGDVTKFVQYKRTKECIDTLMTIASQSKAGVEDVAVIKQALQNLEDNKFIFVSGFKNNVSIIKNFYNSILMGIIADIGFMTTVCVEFIKNPDSTMTLEMHNLQEYQTRFGLVHRNLIKFNDACAKGEIAKAFNPLVSKKIAHESIVLGLGIGSLILLAGIIVYIIIPILRDLTYIFFSFRAHLSDWFKLQEELLNANTIRLQSLKAKNDKETKKVIEAQKKWAERMHKISEMLAIKYVPAEKQAVRQSAIDSKTTVKKDEIHDVDDSNIDSLF